MKSDVMLWIMNVLIILMFVYMLFNRTYLQTNVMIITEEGEIVHSDVYVKSQMYDQTFLEGVSDTINYTKDWGEYVIQNPNAD